MSRSFVPTLLLILVRVWAAFSDSIVTPIVLRPSGQWKGNDGPWETFSIRLGTPPQVVQLLPSISTNEIWAVIPEGLSQPCDSLNSSLCASSGARGGVFLWNQSSTWNMQGLYQLANPTTGSLDIDGNGLYGLDAVGLGSEVFENPQMVNQIVAGIATQNYFLGAFGLSWRPTSFSTTSKPKPSFLSSLNSSARVASGTWSFTQGVYNDGVNSTPASLILGGYDQARFDQDSTITIRMDLNMTLFNVCVSGISFSSTKNTVDLRPLNFDRITAVVESLVAPMWLPISVCDVFEARFGLKWDNSSQLYLISESEYQAFRARNITMSMVVGTPYEPYVKTTIHMPLTDLVMNASAPLVDPPSRYFALKRANNSAQYTLGRVFLQHAYITANYDDTTFDLSQAVYTGDTRIFTLTSGQNTKGQASVKHNLTGGAIGGIVVGSLAVLVAAYCFFAWRSRRWPFQSKLTPQDEVIKPELEGEGKPRLEADFQSQKFEAPNNDVQGELPGPDPPPVELPGIIPRYELAEGH